MENITAISSVLGVLLVGAMSPGPSLVVVVRSSIGVSRQAGIATALGMGVGGVLFATLALLGLQALLMQVPWLYTGLRIVGGFYLMYLAFKLWQGARQTLEMPDITLEKSPRGRKFFLLGLTTQLSNPKTAIVYGSIFAALLPAYLPMWSGAVLLLSVFTIEAGWYIIVAMTFSAKKPRSVYLNSKRWIDRAAGSAMGALGLRLVYDAIVQNRNAAT